MYLRYRHCLSAVYETAKFRESVKLINNSRGVCNVFNNRNVPKLCEDSLPAINRGRYQRFSQKTNRLQLDENNVLHATSVLEPNNELLHEFVFKNIDRWSDKTAVVCSVTGRSYTYAQLKTASERLATSLRRSNIRPGDTIAIMLPNVPEFAIIVLGASLAGARVTTVNPIATAYEIRRQFENAETRLVITLPELNDTIQDSFANNPNMIGPVVVIDSPTESVPSNAIRFSELIADSVERFKDTNDGRTNEDTIFLPYSSGTTGLPKGVELHHRNIVTNCMQMHTPGFNPALETTATHQEVVPLIIPAYHIYGLVVIIVNFLSTGGKIVFVPKFNPEAVLKCFMEYKPTLLYVAPPIISFLATSPLVTAEHLQRLRFAMSGAAPLGASTIHQFLRRADHPVIFSQGWGLTETSPVLTTSDNLIDDLDTVGFLVPSTQLRVVGLEEHNKGQNLGVGEIGELYVKGPQVMKGYYRNPEATAKTMDGEWFITGDVGFYNKTGHVAIKDRLKELIKVKGFQVAPAELEILLKTHDDITDVAVIGEEHPRFGEIPKAFVVLRPGARADADEVKKFVAERVANYKQLGSVQFIDVIPRSAAGKILRRDLKKL